MYLVSAITHSGLNLITNYQKYSAWDLNLLLLW